jgi:pyruvate/2-oxoglutarate dehydrogenase complex dihydrolipoamide dehydrogenase (E3) component
VLQRAREIVDLERGGLEKGLENSDATDRRILGAAVLTTEGAELVHMYIDLMNAIHIHPTLAEDIQSAVS